MNIFELFKRKRKESETLFCAICKMPIKPALQLSPPEAVVDLDKKKVYTLCSFCQLRLHLEPSPQGITCYHQGNPVLDRIEKLIKEDESYRESVKDIEK